MLAEAGDTRGPLHDDEIIVNQWLADDLQAHVGDRLTLMYPAIGPDMRLVERRQTFTIRAVTPIKGLAADRTLTPDFPGISDMENCRDWDNSLVDLGKVRTKDEDYWKQYRGTPKAFVTLAAGQRMWANPLGSLTAARFEGTTAAKVSAAIRSRLTAASQGLVVEDVRERALAAAQRGTDFGQLFLGFSGFLLIAAAALVAMAFALGVRRRGAEVGVLLAIGWRRRRVAAALLTEAAVAAAAGVWVGTAGGLLYARAMLYGLANWWSAAGGHVAMGFYPSAGSIVIGAAAGFAVALTAACVATAGHFRLPARAALVRVGELAAARVRPPRWRSVLRAAISPALAIAGIVVMVVAPPARRADAAAAFFGAGRWCWRRCWRR